MADVTVLFPARMRIVNADGTLTTEALRAFGSLVSLLGGDRGVLPDSLTFALSDGSASQPSLNFVNDTNTGLYRSAPDTLAISSGGQFAAAFGPEGLLLRGLHADAFALVDSNGAIGSTGSATNGQLLIGATGESPKLGALIGSSDQVIVRYDTVTGNIDLGLPQPIQITSSPTFANLTLTGLTEQSFMYPGLDHLLKSTAAATDGQLLIGGTGLDPAAGTLTGTAHQVIVTNAANSITLATPQDIATTSAPTFANLTDTGLTVHGLLFATTAQLIKSTAAPTNGQLLIGATGADPALATITGTANQVTVTNGASSITLALPQDIATSSSPTFAALTVGSLTISGLTANSFLYTGAGGALTTTAAPTNGQLLIGSTGVAPVKAALTGTANQVTVTNGAGSITLALPQDIATTSSPTFANITDSGLTAQGMLYANASKVITSTGAPTNGQLLIGATSAAPALATLTGTSNQVSVTNAANSITLATPQDIGTGSSPTFAGLTVTSLTISGLTANSFVYSGTAGALTSTTAPTNGQLLIGSTGAAPVKAALTGTANQVTVTNGAGSITLALPQDIATSSSPNFLGLRLNGISTASFLYANSSGVISSLGLTINGALLIGSSGGTPAATTITGTANQVTVTNGSGSITLSTPQDIGTGSSPTFANITDSGLTAQGMLYANASKVITSTGAPTNGQLLIGATSAAPALATLTGTANQVTVTNAANSITLALPQDIATSSSPTFGGLTLAGNLTFSGNARRITGDMSSAGTSFNNRVFFQSSVANSQTQICALPNGTNQVAGFQSYSSSSDPSNSSRLNMLVNGSAATVNIQSDTTGTATLLPLTFLMGGTEIFRISTGGKLLIGTTTDDATNLVQVAGNIYSSGNLGINATTQSGLIHTIKDGAANNSFFENYENATPSAGSVHIMRRARGSKASPAVVQSGDRLGGFAFGGQRSTTSGDFVNTGLIVAEAVENFSGTAGGTRLSFEVAPAGSQTRAIVGYWNSTGNLLVGATTETAGAEKLQVNGSLSINSATMIRTYTTFTNGAAANVGTLTNAPAVGNPTKWIPINDNGTTRYIPAW